MRKPNITYEQLKAGLTLPTGQLHTFVVPVRAIRVRLVGMFFETDKTFLVPPSLNSARRLVQICGRYRPTTVLVSGHADTAGSADHNLALSEERAKAVAAFLQKDGEDWVQRYVPEHQKSLVWGVREDQYMLSAVTGADGRPYYEGVVTGTQNSATRHAVRRYQQERGLALGAINEETRRALVLDYMTLLGTPLPAGIAIVVHGCGESHPSTATPDSTALAENRRVEVFLFRGAVMPPAVTPCPAGGCAEYPQWIERTMRTYDLRSELEVVVRLIDELGLPLRQHPVRILLSDGTTQSAMTNDRGELRPAVSPEETFDIIVSDAHEGVLGEATTTASGTHFASDSFGSGEMA